MRIFQNSGFDGSKIVTHYFEPTIFLVDRATLKIVGSKIGEPTILAEQGVEL